MENDLTEIILPPTKKEKKNIPLIIDTLVWNSI